MASFPQELPADKLPADPSPAKGWFRRYFVTRQFLFISVGLHLLFGAGAAVYVAQRIVTSHDTKFTASPPSTNPSTHAQEHKVQMAQKQKTMSAPAQAKRITTTAIDTRVALPTMPAMPTMSSSLTPARMAGMGGNGVGFGVGGGTGNGAAGRSGGPVSLFGLRSAGGGSLVGTFYDLKQTNDGKPTPMAGGGENAGGGDPAEKSANEEASKLIKNFAAGGFNENSLSSYFKGPNPLYTTQIFIPSLPAVRGPKEFGLEDKVKPRRWIVVYRGRVSPPETGRYRFVGQADDYLVVRVNNRVVLDGSANRPTGKKANKDYKYDHVQFPCAEGDSIDATAGDRLEIQVLIGEQPGGNFNTYLMIEKDGVEYAKDGKGNPILPIFKIARSENEAKDGPATAADTSWSVWRADKL